MPIYDESLDAYVTNAPARQTQLDDLAAINKKASQDAIAALAALGVGGGSAPTSLASGAYLNPEPTPAYDPFTAHTGFDAATKAAADRAAADAALKESSKPADWANPPAGKYYQWHVFAGGGGEWRLINAASGTQSPTGSNTGAGGNNGSGNTGSGNSGTGTGNTNTGLTTSQMNVSSALDEFRSVLASVGLGELATQMDQWIKENRQPAEIKTLVRQSDSYARRFPGMAALSAKNMAISEGDYINLERGYTEILNAYGVDTSVFGSRSALGNYIGNQVSAREFEERVNDAAVRVEAQPDVLNALSLYHGVDKSTAIAYLLDPKLGMDVVRKQVRAAEIGAAAMGAGFSDFGITTGNIGSQQAESYVSQIGTEDLQTLKKEFGSAAILAQTQARLASIEGQAYNSDQAIQAAVVGNQQAGLESQRRAAREAARFGGQGSFITRESTVGTI